MGIRLIQGAVSRLNRGSSGISFSVADHQLVARPHAEAYGLESGCFVHALACDSADGDTEDVLVLRWPGHDPIYFGPSLGPRSLALGTVAFLVAAAFHTHWLLLVPAVLTVLHCDFLALRARAFARFATELSASIALMTETGEGGAEGPPPVAASRIGLGEERASL
jgi:hypothetical protein